jgi:hypothetical protein
MLLEDFIYSDYYKLKSIINILEEVYFCRIINNNELKMGEGLVTQ